MKNNKLTFLSALLFFPGLPALLYVLGDFPRRTALKESLFNSHHPGLLFHDTTVLFSPQ